MPTKCYNYYREVPLYIDWEGERVPSGGRDIHRLSVIPRGHVWLEGGNKMSSYVSCDHGAIPLALVQGMYNPSL